MRCSDSTKGKKERKKREMVKIGMSEETTVKGGSRGSMCDMFLKRDRDINVRIGKTGNIKNLF